MKRPMIIALSAMLSIAPTAMMQPAAAQSYASNTAVGAAVGAIVGSLLFDSNRRQYYYVHGNRHVYVSQAAARNYYARRDPHFYHEHQRDFNRHDDHFARDWQHSDHHRR